MFILGNIRGINTIAKVKRSRKREEEDRILVDQVVLVVIHDIRYL